MGQTGTRVRHAALCSLLPPLAVYGWVQVSRGGGQFTFAFGGFGLKMRSVQRSRYYTFTNTGRWPGLGGAVLPLLGIARQQAGKRLAAHPWLLHEQLGKYMPLFA